MKNYSRLFRLKKKKLTKIDEDTTSLQGKEKEIKEIIQNSFKDIFPNFTLLTSNPEYIIEDGEWEGKRLDDLAFDEQKRAFVIFEYKSKVDKEQLDQARGYLYSLANSKADRRCLKDLWDRNWDVKKDFDWESMKVICVSPKFTHKQYGSADKEKVFLVKIAKYKDDKGDIIHFESNHEELFVKESVSKVKGITSKSKPKKAEALKEIKSKEKKSRTPKDNTEKAGISQFLEEWGVDEQTKGRILKIDRFIFQLFGNSTKGKGTQLSQRKHKYFYYFKKGEKNKGQLLYVRPTKTEGCWIHLREEKMTAEFIKHSFRKGGLPKSFTRKVNIHEKESYQRLSDVLKNYLEQIGKEV